MSTIYDMKQMKLSHLLGQLLGNAQGLIAALRYYGAPDDYTDKAQEYLDKLNWDVDVTYVAMARAECSCKSVASHNN